MLLKDRWWNWKEWEEEDRNSMVIWEIEENIGNWERKLEIDKRWKWEFIPYGQEDIGNQYKPCSWC